MSNISAPIYRTEAGVQNHPAAVGNILTNCWDAVNLEMLQKSFREVMIEWDGDSWEEVDVFTPNVTVIALRVDNPCDASHAFVDIPLNDWRLAAACCSTCPAPLISPGTIQPPDGTSGQPFTFTIQIQGPRVFSIVTNIPVWMTATLNPVSGLVTFSGTPPAPAAGVVFEFGAANCGQDAVLSVSTTFDVV